MTAAIKDWPRLINQCYQNIKPGGWLEVQDFDLLYYSEDGSLGKELALYNWMITLLKACEDFGCDPCPGPKLEGWMDKVGFQNVKVERFPLPIGPWPKDKHMVNCPFLVVSDMEATLKDEISNLAPQN